MAVDTLERLPADEEGGDFVWTRPVMTALRAKGKEWRLCSPCSAGAVDLEGCARDP
jgi:hypothetical protein